MLTKDQIIRQRKQKERNIEKAKGFKKGGSASGQKKKTPAPVRGANMKKGGGKQKSGSLRSGGSGFQKGGKTGKGGKKKKK